MQFEEAQAFVDRYSSDLTKIARLTVAEKSRFERLVRQAGTWNDWCKDDQLFFSTISEKISAAHPMIGKDGWPTKL